MGAYYNPKDYHTICIKVKGASEYLEGTIDPVLASDPVLSLIGLVPGLLVYAATTPQPPAPIIYRTTKMSLATANFEKTEPIILVNNTYIGQSIEDPYVAGGHCLMRVLLPGDVVYVRSCSAAIEAGELLIPSGEDAYRGYVFGAYDVIETSIHNESALFKALEPCSFGETIAAEKL